MGSFSYTLYAFIERIRAEVGSQKLNSDLFVHSVPSFRADSAYVGSNSSRRHYLPMVLILTFIVGGPPPWFVSVDMTPSFTNIVPIRDNVRCTEPEACLK